MVFIIGSYFYYVGAMIKQYETVYYLFTIGIHFKAIPSYLLALYFILFLLY